MFYLRSSLLRSLLPGSWVLGCWLQAHAMPYLVNNLPHPFCSKSNESHNWGWREEWQVYFGDSAEMCTRAIFYNYYVDLILHDFTISWHHFCWDIYAILFYPINNWIINQFLQTRYQRLIGQISLKNYLEKVIFCHCLFLLFAPCVVIVCGIDRSLVCLESPSD